MDIQFNYACPCSPTNTLIEMNKAKILLVTQQYTVTEIATFLGFCNAKYFGKRFKKFYKVPPTQYIKEVF